MSIDEEYPRWIRSNVHPRRLTLEDTPVGLEETIIQKEFWRGVYEKKYGIPADPTLVWNDRLAEQDRRNQDTMKRNRDHGN